MNDLLRYRGERLPIRLVLTVAVLLAVAVVAISARVDAGTLAINVALNALLFMQFRLWDDLVDVDVDRTRFPDRVLCQPIRLTKFWLTLLVLFAFNGAVLLLKSRQSVLVFVALNAVFFVWYHARSYFSRFANVMVVLTKYPVIAFVVAGAPMPQNRTPVIAITSVVYACACLYEFLHNNRGQK